MSHEDDLRFKAREAIRTGRLPNRRPERTWGGPGGGADCTICGSPVKGDEIELELQFGGDEQGRDNYHFHIRCFAAWELERQQPDGSLQAAFALPERELRAHSWCQDTVLCGSAVDGKELPDSSGDGMIARRDSDAGNRRGPS